MAEYSSCGIVRVSRYIIQWSLTRISLFQFSRLLLLMLLHPFYMGDLRYNANIIILLIHTMVIYILRSTSLRVQDILPSIDDVEMPRIETYLVKTYRHVKKTSKLGIIRYPPHWLYQIACTRYDTRLYPHVYTARLAITPNESTDRLMSCAFGEPRASIAFHVCVCALHRKVYLHASIAGFNARCGVIP